MVFPVSNRALALVVLLGCANCSSAYAGWCEDWVLWLAGLPLSEKPAEETASYAKREKVSECAATTTQLDPSLVLLAPNVTMAFAMQDEDGTVTIYRATLLESEDPKVRYGKAPPYQMLVALASEAQATPLAQSLIGANQGRYIHASKMQGALGQRAELLGGEHFVLLSFDARKGVELLTRLLSPSGKLSFNTP